MTQIRTTVLLTPQNKRTHKDRRDVHVYEIMKCGIMAFKPFASLKNITLPASRLFNRHLFLMIYVALCPQAHGAFYVTILALGYPFTL
jgi:hypothetical protein